MTATTPTPPLFYHAELGDADGGQLTLAGPEASHIFRARRLGGGDAIQLTDGDGTLARGKITLATRRPLTLTFAVESMETAPKPAREIVLAAAIPKGERQAVMLDMAAQLGMSRFIPLHCERSVTRFHPAMARRWRRIVRSTCKQCRRCHFPAIDEAETEVAALATAQTDGDLMLVGEPDDGQSLLQLLHADANADTLRTVNRVIAVVGPEGGLTAAESKLFADNGAWPVLLGEQLLRVETAAVALLAAVNQLYPPPSPA